MYIFLSILALVCSGAMMFVDKLLIDRSSPRFAMLFKSILLVIFSLILLATNNSFEFIKDFQEIEWLYLAVFGILCVVLFLFYHLSYKYNSVSNLASFKVSSFLLFIMALFGIFSYKSLTHNNEPQNIIFFIVGITALVAAIISQIFISNKDNKINLIYIAIFTLALASMVIGKKVLLPTKRFEVLFFYGSAISLVCSIVMTLCSKEERSTIKKLKWQPYLLLLISACAMALVYVFAYKATTLDHAKPMIINVIIGASFVPIMVYRIIKDAKDGISVKENKMLIVESSLIILGLVSHALAGLL